MYNTLLEFTHGFNVNKQLKIILITFGMIHAECIINYTLCSWFIIISFYFDGYKMLFYVLFVGYCVQMFIVEITSMIYLFTNLLL